MAVAYQRKGSAAAVQVHGTTTGRSGLRPVPVGRGGAVTVVGLSHGLQRLRLGYTDLP